MIQPGKETNPVFPIRPGAGASPNLSNVMQNPLFNQKIFGFDGITVTVGLVILIIALFMVWNLVLKGGRRK